MSKAYVAWFTVAICLAMNGSRYPVNTCVTYVPTCARRDSNPQPIGYQEENLMLSHVAWKH
jgi:hypothetical protein